MDGVDIYLVRWSCLWMEQHPNLIINSLAPERFQIDFRYVIFKLTLGNGGRGISYEIALRWMPLDLTDDKSTLVQVMAWCRQATSLYLSQCWPRSMSPNSITRPQCVNSSPLDKMAAILEMKFLRCVCMNEKICILIWLSLNLFISI